MTRIFDLIIMVLPIAVHTTDILTIDFIKSFIENERKPTDLIHSLCWPKYKQIKMITVLSKSGIRSSLKFTTKHERDHKILFLLDLDCPKSELTIEKAIREKLFRAPYRWLVLTKSSEFNPKMKHILDSPILADCDFVLAERNGDVFRMTQLHKPARAFGPIVYTNRGFYNGTLVDIRPRREMYERRKDLMGNPLIMSAVVQDSNTTQQLLPIESRTELQYDSMTKISWSNAKTVFEMLNSTPQFFFSFNFGLKVNGTWIGMINDLDTGLADVGTHCQMTLERQEAAAYTDMMPHIQMKFIFRQPPLSFVTDIFSIAFSPGVWIALAMCAAFSAFALFLSSRHEVKLGTVSPGQLDGGMNDSLLLTFSAVSQQGCALEPRKLPGRIVLFVLFTAYMALYAAYSASIVVLLTAPSGSIKTLSQLVDSKITLAALDVGYNHFLFETLTDPDGVGVVKEIEPEKGKHHYYTINEGVEKLRQGMFAFHCIVNTLYKRIEETFLDKEKCDLALVDFTGEKILRPVNRNSPYYELLKVNFQRIHETGIHSVHVSRFDVPMPRCNGGGSGFSSVGIGETMPVVIMMLCGFAVACIMAVLEMLVFRMKKIWSNKAQNRMRHLR